MPDKSQRIVIVGGVAGGASAAARLRRLDERAEIILLERGEHISFANCGLPYYIGEVIQKQDSLLVQTPEKMRQRFGIDVRTQHEAVRLDRAAKAVTVRDLAKDEVYVERYDKLILAPGAAPIRPKLPGVDNPRVFALRTIPDTLRIKDFVDRTKPRRAVVVGAGFIGLEVAENLQRRGVKVTVVELADHVIGPLDYEMAALVHQHLKTKEVEFYLQDAVTGFADEGACISVGLKSGRALRTDLVVMGIGVTPESQLAADAGLELGRTGGIRVDATMRTVDPDIYAVGDAVEVKDFVSGAEALIPLAGPANKQGRIAANNICGVGTTFAGTQGTSIVKVFDLTVAVTGNNERALKRRGVAYAKSFTHSASHAGYYPGAIPMAIKLLFGTADGKLLGAQIVGYQGVDKRIDVLATAMRAGMTVHDLEELELAYAPPFSSAKDPVNIAGFAAANILKGDVRVIHWDEIGELDRGKSVLIDVRAPEEHALGSIPGAVNIPVDELRGRLAEIPKDKEIEVFCQVGLRGYLASRILTQHGYAQVRNLSGGYKTYQVATQKQANEDIYEYDEIRKDDAIVPVAGSEMIPVPNVSLKLDACGLQCPGPILQVYDGIKAIQDGEVLEVTATDPAFQEDVKTWCKSTGNRLISVGQDGPSIRAVIRKAPKPIEPPASAPRNHEKAMVVFSNDLDKAIASFIIANGAAAMGRKVTMFFTFWGLNILRKADGPGVKKDLVSRLFGLMMPKGSRKLSLSKMHMAGIGPRMIRYLMNKKNVASLEQLIDQAQRNGVQFVACNMSADLMGIKPEEMIDGVTLGGVATFLGKAEQSDMSLFI